MYKFKCNNMTYGIIEAPRSKLDEDYKEEFPNSDDVIYFGHTRYTKHLIEINEELVDEEKIRTLKHELTHCWLTCNAHRYSRYDEEDVCEVVADINEFINDTVNGYIEYKKIEAKHKEECNCYSSDSECERHVSLY